MRGAVAVDARPTVVTEIGAELVADMQSEEEFCREAQVAFEEARTSHGRCAGAIGGIQGKLTEARRQSEASEQFDGKLAGRVAELESRLEHARARSQISGAELTNVTERLAEKRREHKGEVDRRWEELVAEMVDTLHEQLLTAKATSDKLLELGLSGRGKRDLQFPPLVKSPSTGRSPLDMWYGFARDRIAGKQ